MIIHTGTLTELPPQARIVVLIGNRDSDHLRELVHIAEFKGRIAYRIEDAAELQPRWFSGAEEVGVVLGVSGLETRARAVFDRLEQFSAAQARGMLDGSAQ
jgi:4-hydroxy-3-methylbut-2-enyl diphosphate reductase